MAPFSNHQSPFSSPFPVFLPVDLDHDNALSSLGGFPRQFPALQKLSLSIVYNCVACGDVLLADSINCATALLTPIIGQLEHLKELQLSPKDVPSPHQLHYRFCTQLVIIKLMKEVKAKQEAAEAEAKAKAAVHN